MKNVLLALLLLVPPLACAQWSQPKPADFTINIHVQSTHLVPDFKSETLFMDVLIDGKKYELADLGSNNSVLRVGDYKAKILIEDTSKSYVISRTYELLMPDGSTRKFEVVGESE